MPPAASGPVFVTVTTNVTGWPIATTDGTTDLAIARSARASAIVTSSSGDAADG